MRRRSFLLGAAALPLITRADTATAPRPLREVKFDYVVAGGGFAGVAAALAGARRGLKTCLIERTAALGGLSTQGHVVVFMPICDGFGRQVTYGLAEEMLLMPKRFSRARPNGPWAEKTKHDEKTLATDRYEMNYDPGPMMLAQERALVEAGVTIYYDADVYEVVRRGDGGVAALEVISGGERFRISGRVFTDATGDAALCRLAGAATVEGRQNPVTGWYYAVDGRRRLTLRCGTGGNYRKTHPQPQTFDGDTPEERSSHLITSRQAMIEELAAHNAAFGKDDPAKLDVFAIPVYSTLLRQRRLAGGETFNAASAHRWTEEAVGIFSDWRQAGPVWAMPYRAIVANELKNVTVAGRCLAVADDLWDVTRCLPACCVSGEAAGAASALQVKQGVEAGRVQIAALQADLRKHGVRLDPALVRPHPNYHPATPAALRDEGV